MFLKRAAVTLTIGPLLIVLVYFGGWIYFWPFLIVLSIATFEYTRIIKRMGWHIPLWLLLPMVAAQWFNAFLPTLQLESLIWILSLFITMVYSLWLYEFRKNDHTLSSWFALVCGIFIIGWLGSHFFRIRALENLAWQWTVLTFMSTWIADSGAYLTGHFLAGKIVLGHHQMTPRLSPNKTVEGLIGGIFLATASAAVLAPILNIPLQYGILLGIIVSMVGPLGDLGISLIKREAGVKDSGTLFPGHGGALDRIDSLLWATAIGYYLGLALLK